MAAKLDLAERISYLSTSSIQTKDLDGDYTNAVTPNLEGGALRAGEAPELFSKQFIGLFAQYAGLGLIYGTIPSTVYPFLTVYLNMEGSATVSASALLAIPLSLKVFIGMVTDNFPILGHRRRPYMILGWTLCAISLFIMGVMPMPEPYFVKPEYRKMLKVSELIDGAKYIVLMMLAALGYITAVVASDGMLVEYAQREPEAVRGRTQASVYSVRTMFMVLANIILALGMNGKEYGGDWSKGMSFANVMLLLAIFCVPIITITWFFVQEERFERPNFKAYIESLWEAIQTRPFYQVVAFNFLANLFNNQSYVAAGPIQIFWVKATNLNYNLSHIIGNLVFVIMLTVTGKYGLQWNWRWILGGTAFSIVCIDAVFSMITVWDVFRNQWFWLGGPIVENVPYAMQFIVATFVVVELAGNGNEAACYGLLTTVMNLSQPFAATFTKLINSNFDVWNKDIMTDTHHVRTQVTYTILISYACKIFSLVFLVLLPPQKAATQELKRTGRSSKIMGTITIFYCSFALVWSIMTNLLAIFESTQCLAITGGCHNN
ncbi:hypothetical protein Poli38472_010103 [Pythium oligandrum]|uniref:Transmembrane protein n=1 Tax=Pythium oligandrum TaxID=41045 RepID=A0A8K1FF20_PYTOL|nr:hypothetical protein Poli38472_010103 [Pythium oligandrum]|eukprot:TMW58544.1 hypothetical protein Poli38472_010103 [Pythium oligandrum]